MRRRPMHQVQDVALSSPRYHDVLGLRSGPGGCLPVLHGPFEPD
jgi:hypothetical protein